MKCKSCEENNVGCELNMITTPTVYKICLNCLQELINTSLSPIHFKNLLKSGHKDTEFYLHSDFYDEEGNALQPR